MALVRCPSCGRVADGNVCFACGHEWSDDPAAPPAAAPTAPTKTPSVKFETQPPSSFPVATPVAPSTPPEAAPPAAPIVNTEDEFELDMEFGGGDEVDADDAIVGSEIDVGDDGMSDFGNDGLAPFPAAPAGAGFDSPAFGSSPGSNSFSPPAAFGGTPAFGSAPAPSRSFGISAGRVPSQKISAPSMPTPAPSESPWGAPPAGPIASPPRMPSAAFGAIPQSPSLSQPPSIAALPPVPGTAPSWGSNPTLALTADLAEAAAAEAAAAAGVAGAPESSWGSNPTRVVRSPGEVGDVSSTPASLSGLFDGLDANPAAEVPPPEPPAPPEPPPAPPPPAVTSAADEAGDIFNFSLEPGATVEPDDAGLPSPFSADSAEPQGLVHDLAAIPTESAGDFSPSPPPGAGVGSDGAFAEIDMGVDVDVGLGIDAPLPDMPPLADFSMPEPPAPADDDAMADIVLEEDLPEPPPLVDFSAPAGPEPVAEMPQDFSGFPDDGVLPAPPPLADFSSNPTGSNEDLSGLALEVGLDDVAVDIGDGGASATMPELPADDDAMALGAIDALGEDPVVGDMTAEVPAQLSNDTFNEATAAGLPEAPAPTGPTLSLRVGVLAEGLEEEGRFADAALLYEVQAALAALGR